MDNKIIGGNNGSFSLCWKYFRNRLNMLFIRFFKNTVVAYKAFNIVKHYNKNDIDVYNKLTSLYNNSHKKESEEEKNIYRKIVADTKLNHLKKFLKKYKNKNYKKY